MNKPHAHCLRSSSESEFKKHRWIRFLRLLYLSCLCTQTAGASVTLEWDANPDPNIAGYIVYTGTASGSYSKLLDAGNTTTAVVPDPPANGTQYYVVTACDADGVESDPSDEIRITAPVIFSSPVTSVVANTAYTCEVNASGDPPPVYTLVTAPAGMSIDAASGIIQWTPAAAGSFAVTVKAENGVPPDAVQTFTVVVAAPPNQPPAISAISNRTFSEDTSSGAIAFTVSDAETAAGSLTVTGTSSNPALIPNASVVLGGSGGSRTVTLTPLANQNGTANVTLTVSDGSLSATLTFGVTVSPVNDPPVAVAQNVAVTGGGSVSLTLSGSDIDGDALTYVVGSAPVNGTLSGSAPSLTYTPAPGFSGTDSFTYTARDGSSVSAPATVSLTVTAPVNQPPAISAISNRTFNEDTSSGAIAFTVSDGETAAGSLTVAGTSSNPTLIPNANVVLGGSGGSRTVTLTPAANQNGTATITLTVSDGSLSVTRTFGVTVSPVNDPPVAMAQNAVVTAGGSVTITLNGSDIEGDALTYAIVSAPAHGTLSGTSPLTYTPAAGFSGNDSFTFTVSDGSSVSAPATVSITVTAVQSPWALIARTGGAAPGVAGANFASFSSSVRSDGDGDAAFLAQLNSSSSTATGVWAETDGLLELIVRQGGAAPGVTGGLFDVLTVNPGWSGTGELFIQAKLRTGSAGISSSNDTGFWYKPPAGPLQLLAREGAQAPGLAAGALFTQFYGITPGNDGLWAFTAALKTSSSLGITSSNDTGIWSNFTGAPSLLAREGFAAPGTPNGAPFTTFSTIPLSVNSTGQLAFSMALNKTTGITEANRYGVWMWDGTKMAKVVRGGEQAPGTPAGALFLKPGTPLLRDAVLVFQASLAVAGTVTTSNDSGVWVLENGVITLLAREGSAAPGGPSGNVFSQLTETIGGNDRGDIVYKASMLSGKGGVTSSNNDGLWSRSAATGNVFTLIAREGTQAPGAPTGALFTTFDTPIVTGGGREAFTATLLAGVGGVTTSNDRGLWMRAANGQLALMLREGSKIPVTEVETLTVSDIVLNNSSTNGAAGSSDGNAIKLLVKFTNGSSAVLSFDPP